MERFVCETKFLRIVFDVEQSNTFYKYQFVQVAFNGVDVTNEFDRLSIDEFVTMDSMPLVYIIQNGDYFHFTPQQLCDLIAKCESDRFSSVEVFLKSPAVFKISNGHLEVTQLF